MNKASAPPPESTAVVIEQSVPTRATDDLPPRYEESTNADSAPPSYETLYGEFQQVNTTKGLTEFVAKVFAVIIGTVTAAILIAVLNVIPLAMLILGILNLNNCQVESYIPIWLIVTGVFSLLKSSTSFYYRWKWQQQGRLPAAQDVNPNPFDCLLSSFLMVWFIIGSVWIYSVYREVQYINPDEPTYCDNVTYLFSFVFVTLGYILLAMTMCCFCCCCCCICCKSRSSPGIIRTA